MKTEWTQFKDLIDSLGSDKIDLRMIENSTLYLLALIEKTGWIAECVLDKNPSDSTDLDEFEADYKSLFNQPSILKVETQFERTDLDLKLAMASASVDTNTGECEISLLVPGTPLSGDGRYVSGGLFFFDEAHAGDSVTKIAVVDVDDIYGYGPETYLKTYTDEEVNAANCGHYIPVKAGHLAIETFGFYGFIPAGLYLEVYAQKATSHFTGTAYCNINWGKKS